MDFAFFDIAILLITCFVMVIVILIFSFSSNSSDVLVDYEKGFNVIDVVKALRNICPVNSSSKWKLLSLDFNSLRCWQQKFSFSILGSNINLYGSAAVANCSSMRALSEIADLSKWSEWNPSIANQFLVKSMREKHLRRDHYMQANQVIGIQRGTNIQSYLDSYRFMSFNEKKVGWVLFWNVKKLEFMFYLIQPIISNAVSKSCLITHIFGTTSCQNPNPACSTVQRLKNLQDLLSLSSLTVVPLKFDDQSSRENASVSGTKVKAEDFSVFLQLEKDERHNTVFILVPFSDNTQCNLQKLKGFKLAVKNIKMKTINTDTLQKDESAAFTDKRAVKRHSIRRAVSDLCMKTSVLLDINKNTKILDANNPKQNTFKSYVNSLNKVETQETSFITSKLPPMSEEGPESWCTAAEREKSEPPSCTRNVEAFDSSETTTRNDVDHQNLPLSETLVQDESVSLKESSNHLNIDVNEENVLALDKQDQNEMFCSSFSDYEIVLCEEFSDSRLADFLTQGNCGAAELQAEILLASFVDQNSTAENFKLEGGWAIHTYYKGMPVLSKSSVSHFMKTTSFLCQTIIPVPPKDVWKYVKNPRFRFISDETVKSVEILDKISNSQKLIHIYHENAGFLKKEMMDFCLLHTEREEKSRCYSAFHSIEYDKCPFMNGVTRGILRPSGWVVEEVENNSTKSKVSYMLQILVSSPDSSYIQNLSNLVPLSVYNLKNYATVKPM